MSGSSILLLDTEPRTHNHYITLALAEALRRHPAVARVAVAHHGNALSTFVNEGLDTFIAFGGAPTHAPLLARLARLSRLSLLWTTEDPYERGSNVRFSGCFDLVFTNDRSSVAAYGGRARHLPLAASPLFQDFEVGADDRHYLYDLLFVGTAWPNRVASLNAILGRLPSDLKVKLALPWNVHIGPPDLGNPSLFTDWRCGNTDFARLANRSRVVLTLPRVFSGSGHEHAAGSTPPPRLFETALAGGFQVMVSPEPEVSDYYVPDSEFLLCESDEAGAAAIKTMLAAPEERMARARAARARTLAEHLYDHRVAAMLDVAAAFRRERPVPAPRPRRTVLVLTHNRLGHWEGDGVEIYQEALVGLREDHDVLFLFPVFDGEQRELRLQGTGVEASFPCGPAGLPKLTDPFVEGIFERILFEQRVDLVHIQHLLHLPLSLPLIAKACGVPVVYHLHDHYLICDRGLLLDHNGRFCDVVRRGRDQCDACLAAGNDYPAGAKARRVGFLAHVVDAIDVFVTSTPATGAYLRAFYPTIAPDRLVEIEMPVSTSAPAARRPVENTAEPAPLVVAVIGNFGHHKGGDDIVDLIRTCADYRIHFMIYGHMSEHDAGRLRSLPPDRVTVHGPFDQSDIVARLARCDVSLHLSIWPETYVIALTEAWLAGLVPIVSDIGALSERVTDGYDGLKVAPHDPGAVRAKLLALYFDRGRLARMRATILRKSFGTVQSHLAALRGLYERLIARRPCPHDRVPDRRQASYDLALPDLALRVNAPSWVVNDVIWDRARATLNPDTPDSCRVVQRIEALPEADAALPVLEMPLTHPRLVRVLDGIWTDGRRLADGVGRAVAVRSLALRGWLYDREAGEAGPPRTYLRFTKGTATSYAPLNCDMRPDVADNLSGPAALQSGFSGHLNLAGLPFGIHAVDLLQVAGGRLLVARGLFQVFAAADGGMPRAATFRRCAEPETDGRAPPLRDIRQSLPEANGILLAAPGETWAFEGRLDGLAAERGEPFSVWLRASDGTALRLDAEPEPRQDGTIRFVAALTGLEHGTYEPVLRTGRGETRAIPMPFQLAIVTEDSRCRETEALPGAFRPRLIKRLARALHLDAVTAVPGRGTSGPLVRCRGWAFLQGLGAPLCVVARWEEKGRTRIRIGASLVRPDVEAHLGTPQALATGFDVTVPATTQGHGAVRFFQCYRRRTVEFTGFQTAVSQAVPKTG